MSAVESVVVVGAGLAGHASVRALRHRGFDGRITVIGEEPDRPYDRPPLSKDFLAGSALASDLSLEAEDEDLGVDWLLGMAAEGLDPATNTVALTDGSMLSGDAVVVATGSRARTLPGVPTGVHTVRALADAQRLKADLLPDSRLVVVGAGFIGAEIAATARHLGLEVTILEAAPAPLAGPLGVEMGAAVAALHDAHGVDLRCGVPVAGFTGDDQVTGVALTNGSVVPADVVVVGIGSQPNVEWLAGSGLDISAGLICSAAGETTAPGVVGVGDCAAWFDDQLGRPHRIEHWTDSRDRPAVAMAALLGDTSPQTLRAPYFWSDQYGVRIQFAGRRHGDEEVTVEAGSVEGHDLLALYRRNGEPTAVLGMNQPKLFTRYRKALPPTVVVPGRPVTLVPA